MGCIRGPLMPNNAQKPPVYPCTFVIDGTRIICGSGAAKGARSACVRPTQYTQTSLKRTVQERGAPGRRRVMRGPATADQAKHRERGAPRRAGGQGCGDRRRPARDFGAARAWMRAAGRATACNREKPAHVNKGETTNSNPIVSYIPGVGDGRQRATRSSSRHLLFLFAL
jgi:hypothetical protein